MSGAVALERTLDAASASAAVEPTLEAASASAVSPTAEAFACRIALHAARFAAATAQLLDQLASGSRGDTLAPLLRQSVQSLRHTDLRVERSDDSVLVNQQTLAPMVVSAWATHLRSHGVQRVHFHRDASASELLHFLALLAHKSGDRSLSDAWLERGAWRIHVGLAEDSPRVSGTQGTDATERLLTALVAPGGQLTRDVTDDELQQLANSAAQGTSIATDSPLLHVLRQSGERSVKALLVTLANTTGGSQRRTLFELVATLNVGHPYLVALLAHPTWFVVRNAASLLGELRVPGAELPLAQLLTHEEPRVRVAAVTALGNLPSERAADSLMASVSDRAPTVRAAAWSAWQHRSQAPTTAIVDRALRTESDEAAQRALLDCVARFDALDVANALVRFCAHGAASKAPRELLAYGIELLARRRPQSARQFLRHLADQS